MSKEWPAFKTEMNVFQEHICYCVSCQFWLAYSLVPFDSYQNVLIYIPEVVVILSCLRCVILPCAKHYIFWNLFDMPGSGRLGWERKRNPSLRGSIWKKQKAWFLNCSGEQRLLSVLLLSQVPPGVLGCTHGPPILQFILTMILQGR